MPYTQNKTTYVKPICNRNGDHNFYKGVAESHVQHVPHIPRQNEDLHSQKGKNISLESLNETKEKGINRFESLHSTLFNKVEKMQKWKALVEVDTKQKNKKIEELNQLIETFRKVKVDLQMQNENLSLQLSKERQQRSLVLERFNSTKKLCSALKKHFDAVQVHFEYRNTIEETFKATDSKRLRAIEDMKIQFRDLCNENAEKISYLDNALASEINKSMTLKETLEQTVSVAASKEKSLCDILSVRESEIMKLADENDDKSKKLQKAFHDIDELSKKVSELEKLCEFRLQNMNEMEHKLRVAENSKLDFETQYLQEKTKVQDLKEKCKELEEFGNNIKIESEKCVNDLKKINLELESSVEDWMEKHEEKLKENEHLLFTLRKKDEEIIRLEKEISEVANDKSQLEEKCMGNIQEVQSRLDEVLTERNGLNLRIENISEKLHEIESENKELKRFLVEEKEKFSKLEKAYETMALEAKEKRHTENELAELLMSTKELEGELSLKTEELKSQQENILKLQTILTEKEKALLSLQYENVEMKDWIASEKKSVKICLECDSLRDEVKEINALKEELAKKDEELSIHKCSAVETLKMLAEMEKNYNADWISKEKEITQCKDLIRGLEEELKTAKIMAGNIEQVTLENAKLKAELEELLKQKASTFEQLTLENIKLKTELEELPKQKNKRLNVEKLENTSSEEEIQIISEAMTKAVPKIIQSKTIPVSNKPQAMTKAVPKIIQSKTFPVSNKPQAMTKAVPKITQSKTFPKLHKPEKAPSTQVEKKRKWDCESSDSDCYELASDKNSNLKLLNKKRPDSGFIFSTPKASLTNQQESYEFNIKIKTEGMTSQQEHRSNISIPSRKLKTPNSQLHITALSTPKVNTFQRKDFLTIEKVNETPAPCTPMQRKFFTTPLSARSSSSKKPSQLWL